MTKFKKEDFEGSGQYLIYDRDYDPENKSYITTLVKKVGWKMNPGKRVLLIAMSDGWTTEGHIEGTGPDAKHVPWTSKEVFIDWLNSRGSVQGVNQAYRFATEGEVRIACTYNKNRIKG